MEVHMKGQFYVIAGFMIMAYIYFMIQLFTVVQTDAEVSKVRIGDDIKSVFQSIIDEGGEGVDSKISLFQSSLGLRSEAVYLYCKSYADSTERCDLTFPHWVCGVNISLSSDTQGQGKVQISDFLQTKYDFWKNVVRVPVFISGNVSSNLEFLSITSPFRGSVYDGHTFIKGEWSGTNVTFRYNVRSDPKTIYIYNQTSESYNILEDVGILNDGSYNSALLYEKLSAESPQNISFTNIESLWGSVGPKILFIPSGSYPAGYGSELVDYVNSGGTLVSPYGLCNSSGGGCLVGDIFSYTGAHTLAGIGDFEGLDVSNTNSQYFTTKASPWVVLKTGVINQSAVAIGPIPHGEGWVVFVGNESMLSNWASLSDFLTLLKAWGLPPTQTTLKVCPVQNV